MAQMPRFVPTNFALKNVTHGPVLGATAGEVTQTTTDAAMLAFLVNGQEIKQTDAQEWTAYRDLIIYGPLNTPLPGLPTAGTIGAVPIGAAAAIIARTRALVERYKNHPAYTQAIGEDLGIISTDDTPGPSHPTLTGNPETDYVVRLGFAMLGHDMIEIQCQRGNEADFTSIGFDTATPYFDSRAPLTAGQPETRRYRARFVDNGVPIGDWSDIITVTAQA